ncbi:hypothetical protein J2X68_001070 [Streptomyces sp. 3330]|uniref:hypothetical protein n=1 Tax=Streptomyces sp. 3330 TaxID=2817755 RepID=UPI00285E5576|nr:hypothetical protein [Streptomyces sp. 3330]MDR6974392.1 hypothetical protein [Streptomyces sp. 3330]
MYARRLRFTQEPRTVVRFPGTGKRESLSHSDRTHLPDPVIPGHTYQDVTVAYHLATRLAEEPEAGRSGDDDADE